ncbi:MAG: Coq4 family protein [Cyanobacteria bacterium P01_A01_bin.123]
MIRAQREHRFGDFAILKADLLGAKANDAIAPQLTSVIGYYPPIDLDALLQLPQDSFGYAYAQHMNTNQLTPIHVSPALDEVARRNVFALRYAVTHDIFHVLLGFDTSYAGEIGVLAFAVEQGYSEGQKFALTLAKLIYPILAPGQRQAIAANVKTGQAIAKQADFLLGYRFEDHWHEPLEIVKAQLRLDGIKN